MLILRSHAPLFPSRPRTTLLFGNGQSGFPHLTFNNNFTLFLGFIMSITVDSLLFIHFHSPSPFLNRWLLLIVLLITLVP